MTNLLRFFSATALVLLLDACGSSAPDTGAPGTSPVATGMPKTIPALWDWQAGTGAFRLTEGARILVASSELQPVAEVFAEDLLALTGRRVAIVNGPATPGAGDLSLSLGANDSRLGREGYRLTVGDTIAISANESAGAFYGTRTVLQLLHQGETIPVGEALDWPRYPERGLMIDNGDLYFTPAWIRAHIRDLAYLKMNYLHLHFSDNNGFRIESDGHPEIVATQHLTKLELAELLALAERYFITVVPEIDMPGHMTAALAPHPELQLTDPSGRKAADKLDVTHPAARQFAQELMEEFLPLFPGPYWHIGGDEYMPRAQYDSYPQLRSYAVEQYGASANAVDAVHDFFNFLDGIARAHGKTTRIWNDEMNGGSAVTLSPGIVVDWWTDIGPISDPTPPGAQDLLDRGHTIMNCGWFPTYYNTGVAQTATPRPDMREAYEHWEANEFAGPFFSPAAEGQAVRNPPEVIAADEPRNLGSKVHVWTAFPDPEADIAEGIFPFLRVLSQKTWESPPLSPSYSDYEVIMDEIGRAPGYALE